LTFNHQRRFGTQWAEAKALLDDGEIGALERVETAAPTLYDWGTHCVDLANFFAGDADVEWVLGQVDYREENLAFGQHNANQALAQWRYDSGVTGLASTGAGTDALGGSEVYHRLVGSEGVIETHADHCSDETLRVRRHDDPSWTAVETEPVNAVAGGLADALAALEDGTDPALGARNALRATEVIFGTYESARSRARVDLPLEIEDNPLASMVESGALTPE
jgi:predicted dehydrogenase